MRAPQVADYYTAAWPDFTPALTQRAGIDAAKADGIYKGRKKNVDEAEIRRRITAGATKAAVARELNISRMTVYRALEGQCSQSASA